MTCANVILTILALIIIVFAMWPDIAGVGVTQWVLLIAAIIVIIVAWTGVKCKYCKK